MHNQNRMGFVMLFVTVQVRKRSSAISFGAFFRSDSDFIFSKRCELSDLVGKLA
jgi:hypothetical protein